jgi:hypothetical protein
VRRVRAVYFLCLDDLTYPNDVIRREHSPPLAPFEEALST